MGLHNRITLRRFLILLYLFLSFLTACRELCFLSELKSGYTNTRQMLVYIAAAPNPKEAALNWLKEPPEDFRSKAAGESIATYGYDIQTVTVWDKAYHSARRNSLILSAAFELLLFLSFYILYFLQKKRQQNQAVELEKILCQIQDTDSGLLHDSKELDDILKDRIRSLQEQIQSDHNRLLQEKEATKSLVTDISHQLKTPVAALKTSLELLAAEDLSNEEKLEFLNSCMLQAEGLENLTKTLVNVSRMEKGLVQNTAKPSDIMDTLRTSVSRIYEKAQKKQISIELEDTFCGNTQTLHDPKWTAEVFVNILDNAIKYSGEHTRISIRLSDLVHFIKIEFEDEGIGIAKSDYHKIFQRFYRGESAAGVEGSGVGLYLARNMIDKQNGTIFVRSKSGSKSGSIFSIQLPKA